MSKIAIGAALAAAAIMSASPARALQAFVTQVEKNGDGTMTYHFAVKLDSEETLAPGEGKVPGDFVTVYNFYGLVDGSAKAPKGWAFTSEEFGRPPTINGYPAVLPLDVPNTPNLTWSVTEPIAAGAKVEGFSATTRVGTSVDGEYSGQATRQSSPAKGLEGAAASTRSKQAVLGALPTPSFLAEASK